LVSTYKLETFQDISFENFISIIFAGL